MSGRAVVVGRRPLSVRLGPGPGRRSDSDSELHAECRGGPRRAKVRARGSGPRPPPGPGPGPSPHSGNFRLGPSRHGASHGAPEGWPLASLSDTIATRS